MGEKLNKLFIKANIKKENLYNDFLSLLLSVLIVCMTRVHFSGNVWHGNIDETYFDKFGLSAFILGTMLFFVFRFLLKFIDIPLQNAIKKIAFYENNEKDKKKVICTWCIIIFIAWLPYYLSYYPGGVYADTFMSIEYIKMGVLTNRHPFLYTMVIGFFINLGNLFGKDLTWSIGFFTAVQMLVIECEFVYFVSWMLHHKISHNLRIFISLFFVFFPLIPLYAVSVWKDTPFCMAVLFWMFFVVNLYFEISNGIFNKKTFAGFGAGIFLTAFTRNNGIYIVSFVIFVLVTIIAKKSWLDKKLRYKIIINSVFMAIAIYLIQGPGYKIAGISHTDGVENFGIPLQQIAAVVAYDGVVTEEQKEFINNFIPYEKIKEIYTPTTVDNLKWNQEFNWNYLSMHKPESIKLWLQLLKQNPTVYIKSYLMATLGFWNVDISDNSGAYVQNFVWNNGYNIVQTDYFNKWFGFSFQHFVNPRHYISCAWFFWIFFVTTWFVVKHYGLRSCFLFMPQMGIWFTLMIATPVASSLRYIASNMFTLPFVIIVPLFLERNGIQTAQNRENGQCR
ncbi:MAG: hypothetical protein HFH68_01010 [Lachnospiraceae bacterium]|nr:hypothetical protein [Lachnospiraceae bacterium]